MIQSLRSSKRDFLSVVDLITFNRVTVECPPGTLGVVDLVPRTSALSDLCPTGVPRPPYVRVSFVLLRLPSTSLFTSGPPRLWVHTGVSFHGTSGLWVEVNGRYTVPVRVGERTKSLKGIDPLLLVQRPRTDIMKFFVFL